MDRLHRQLDGLEPRANGSVACCRGIVQHRAPLLSGAEGLSDGSRNGDLQAANGKLRAWELTVGLRF